MAKVLATDELTVIVKFEDREEKVTAVYNDFFKVIHEKCCELFGIEAGDARKYALFQENGTRVPNTSRIYDNAEVSDGTTLIFKPR